MAHVKAMEALAQRYPQDDEAQIAYAILLNVSAPLGDKTYAQQLKGAAILEPISQRLPQHPGVTHYLIHLYDYPPLAQKGLDGRQPLRQGGAGCAACAAHAVAHLHARRLLEGIDRRQYRIGECGAGAQRRLAGSCMPATTWSTPISSWPRTTRRATSSTQIMAAPKVGPAVSGGQLRGGGQPGALCGRARRLERRERAAGEDDAVPACRRDHAFRPRARSGARRQSGGRHGRHRQACRAARHPAQGQRRLLVGAGRHPARRSRPPGCCMPKASTTRRCAR